MTKMIKRASGKFPTRYGPCDFSMFDRDEVSIYFQNSVIVRDVEYTVRITLYRNEDDTWMVLDYLSYIGRKDNKPMAYNEEVYGKVTSNILLDFINFITNHQEILSLADFAKLETERARVYADLRLAESKVVSYRRALLEWNETYGEEYNRLWKSVQDFTKQPYAKLE